MGIGIGIRKYELEYYSHFYVWLNIKRNEKIIPLPYLVIKICIEIERNYKKIIIIFINTKNYINII